MRKFLFMLIALTTTLGCQTPGLIRKPESNSEIPIGVGDSSPATVTIGGFVRQPKSVEHSRDLTLNKLVAMAGGLNVDSNIAVPMICISKNQGLARQRIYFPYHYVVSSVAGDIRLSPNDDVTVVDVESTSLGNRNSQRKMQVERISKTNPEVKKFQVSGLVKRAGRYEADDFNSPVVSFGQLFASSRIDIDHTQRPDIAIVRRERPDGIGKADFFLLPIATLASKERGNDMIASDETASGTSDTSPITPKYGFEETDKRTEEKQSGERSRSQEKNSNRRQSVNEMAVNPLDQIVITRATRIPMVYRGLTAPILEGVRSTISTEFESRQEAAPEKTDTRLRNRLGDRFGSRLEAANDRLREMLQR
jgi:hypothetical protein